MGIAADYSGPDPMTERSDARRVGPAAATAATRPERWPRVPAIAVVSPNEEAREQIVRALAAERGRPDPPARVVHEAADLRALADAAPEPAYCVVDARTEDARAFLARGHREWLPPACPVLWVVFDDPSHLQAAAGPAWSAADADLRWDDALGAVPFRTRPDEEPAAFAARLRGRLATLLADLASEHLFAEVTLGHGRLPPKHQALARGCRACAPGVPRAAVGRTTAQGRALLRLLLRPERLVGATSYAALNPDARATSRAGSPAHLAARPLAHAAAVQRACRDAALVSPRRVAVAALVLRASALSGAFGLGNRAVARLLGFTGANGAPAESTWYRTLAPVLGRGPECLPHLLWPDLHEAVRRAITWPAAATGRDVGDRRPDVGEWRTDWAYPLRVREVDARALPSPQPVDPGPFIPRGSVGDPSALRPYLPVPTPRRLRPAGPDLFRDRPADGAGAPTLGTLIRALTPPEPEALRALHRALHGDDVPYEPAWEDADRWRAGIPDDEPPAFVRVLEAARAEYGCPWCGAVPPPRPPRGRPRRRT